jgi:hypothetical protein
MRCTKQYRGMLVGVFSITLPIHRNNSTFSRLLGEYVGFLGSFDEISIPAWIGRDGKGKTLHLNEA